MTMAAEMASVSNARPLVIFTGYMIAASALTVRCITTVVKARKSSTQNVQHRPAILAVFAALAAISLATTWYYMFCYFRWSYLAWATSRNLEGYENQQPTLLLGEWLRDTSLFKQAWASTLETTPRAWWSLQIFGFCANWSVMLAVQAKRRNIPYAWAFMLLGQIVAISFAMNLFFLAVLVHQVAAPTSKSASNDDPSSGARFWHICILGLNVSLALSIPDSFGQPVFMWLLLGPHVLAFLPLLLAKILPAKESSLEPSWLVKVGVLAAIVVTATMSVMNQYGQPWIVIKTLHEHPAVSSVGWDVICCWTSLIAWFILGEA